MVRHASGHAVYRLCEIVTTKEEGGRLNTRLKHSVRLSEARVEQHIHQAPEVGECIVLDAVGGVGGELFGTVRRSNQTGLALDARCHVPNRERLDSEWLGGIAMDGTTALVVLLLAQNTVQLVIVGIMSTALASLTA